MKKLALSLLALAACNPLHLDSKKTREEVSQSVYRLSEEVEVDPRPYCDDADPDMKQKCIESVGTTHTFGWTGTGWVISHGEGRSFVMTAGHLCESGKTYAYESSEIGVGSDGELTFVKKTYQLPILKVTYDLHAADGTVYHDATALGDDDEDDLCELSVPGDLGPAIPLADRDPVHGQHCYVTGAPHGLWGGGVALTFDAVFDGRGALWGGKDPEGLFFTGPAAGGASGSPIVCDGEAVGVLNLGARNWELFSGVPYEAVALFHRAVHHGAPKKP